MITIIIHPISFSFTKSPLFIKKITRMAIHSCVHKTLVLLCAGLFFSCCIFAQPVISSFTPASGAIGTTVTITGTNFNTTSANNAVFFGDTKAVVTAASATSLTVTVPAGASYKYISVTNTTTGLTAYSSKPFIVTFANAGTRGFTPKLDIATGTKPNDVTTGDLDGDGKTDMVVVNTSSNSVSVFRNTSSVAAAGFAAKQDITVGTLPQNCVLGDINGDGKPDLIVTASTIVSVFRNTSTPGTISFAAKVDLTPTGGAYGGVNVADIDGDGKPDLVVVSDGLDFFRNTSSGTTISFAAKINIGPTTFIHSATVGDIDGDGKPDIAVILGAAASGVSAYRNTSVPGTISFAAKVDIAPGGNLISLALSDLDGDGKPDLVEGSYRSLNLVVQRNTSTSGNISFAPYVDLSGFSNGTYLSKLVVSDIDGDGKPDISTANNLDRSISYYRNTSVSGTLSFVANIDNAAANGPWAITSADIDGDGRIDLIVANDSSNTVSVFRNIILPPTITTFSPASGAIGSSVTITGTNFNTTAANNLVFFGDTKATVTAATATSLTVTVPAGATYKYISTTNLGTTLTGYSAKPFIVSFTSTGILGFSAGVNLPAGVSPYDVVSTDIDGDGKTDLVTTNYGTNTISVFRNTSTTGTASFAAKIDLVQNAGSPTHIAFGDFDADGKSDMAVGTASVTNIVSIFKNNSTPGTISFGARTDISLNTGYSAEGVSIGDVDMDGKPDLVTAGLNGMSILRNITSGTIAFAAPFALPSLDLPYEVKIGDFDGDGKPDLVAANFLTSTSNLISVSRNNSIPGSLSFQALQYYVGQSSTSNTTVCIGDLDGDGKPDISFNSLYSGDVSFLRNTSTSGTINFGARIFAGSLLASEDIYTGASSIMFSDMDGDGKTDVIANHYRDSSISLLRNTSVAGSLNFSLLKTLKTLDQGGYISIQDVDGDGKPDMAVANSSLNSASVYLLTFSSPPGIAVQSTDKVICSGTNTKVFVQASGTGPFTYRWQVDAGSGFANLNNTVNYSGTTTDTLFITGATTALNAYKYRCVVTNLTGSTNSNAATLTVNALPTVAAITGSSSVCVNASTTLADATAGGVWASANTAIATVNSSGIVSGVALGATNILYTVTLNGCSTAVSAAISVTNTAPVVAAITGSNNVCVGNSITLSNATAGGVWSSANVATATINSGGSATGVAAGSAQISYTVVNGSGCSNAATFNLTVNALPLLTVQAAFSSISKGATVQLTAIPATGTISWTPAATLDNPASFTPTAKPPDNTTYTATVTAAGTGCTSTKTISITVIEDFKVTPIQVITHNGDGINDYFVIDNITAYPDNTLQVFDKQGKLVFEATNYHNEWKGEVNGKVLANDTYFYVLKIKGAIIKKGSVTIIH
jgi:gliding motility-associated-like protein